MLVATGLCAATAGFMPPASSALSFTAPSTLARGGVAAASRARPVFANENENSMEPEGGWGVDNLMDMMDAADDDDDEDTVVTSTAAAATAVASVQSWYDSGARLNGAALEAIGTADDAVDSSTLFLLHFNKISAEGLQTIQRREWVNLIDKSRSNIERRQRVADEAPAATTRLWTQMLKEEGTSVIEARGTRMGECNQILKLVRLKEEGGRVVRQREEICAAMVSLMPTRATALSAAAPDGFEWGPVF